MQWADISAKMPLAIKAGKGPDVSVAHGDDLATYAAQGLLLKSDGIVKTLGYGESDFPAGVFNAGNYKGAQYAIPWSVTPLGLYVNNAVLKKAGLDPAALPTDKAGYLKALDALKAAGVQGEWVDGYVFTGTFEFESLIWQFGGELYNKDVTQATFNSDAGVQALTWMTDLIKNGHSPANVAQDGNFNALVAARRPSTGTACGRPPTTRCRRSSWTAAPVPQIGTQKAVWSSSTHWIFLGQQGRGQEQDGRGGDVRQVDERQLRRLGGHRRTAGRQHGPQRPVAAVQGSPEPEAVPRRAALRALRDDRTRASTRPTRRSPPR